MSFSPGAEFGSYAFDSKGSSFRQKVILQSFLQKKKWVDFCNCAHFEQGVLKYFLLKSSFEEKCFF